MPGRPVFYFARFVPDYRIAVLECLNERLDGRLVVCAGHPPSRSSFNSLVQQHERSFRQVQLRNYWLRGETLHAQPFRAPFRLYGDPAVVLAEESPRSATLPLLLRYARKHGAGRVLWGHFSSLNRPFDPEHSWLDRYRLALARRVDACACYTDGAANLLRPFVPADKLFVAYNTLDLDILFSQYDRLATEGKAAVRARLGLPQEAPVVAFIGRLVPGKGTSLLLDTFARLRADGPATLLIIGDGPERPVMEARIARDHIGGVRFLGPLPFGDEEAAPYLYAADVMLMPGYLGLVINHAFAFGLPVVSCETPIGVAFHSPEVEYVRSGENGLLTAGQGPDDLARAVRTVLADHDRYAANARAFARRHLTIDRMVDGLYSAIRYAEHPTRFT